MLVSPCSDCMFSSFGFLLCSEESTTQGTKGKTEILLAEIEKVRLAAYARQLETCDKHYNGVIVECDPSEPYLVLG